jgi:hypothetical protein
LKLHTDGQGNWQDGEGKELVELDGCRDIDICPTPFTNSFPLRRESLARTLNTESGAERALARVSCLYSSRFVPM